MDEDLTSEGEGSNEAAVVFGRLASVLSLWGGRALS